MLDEKLTQQAGHQNLGCFECAGVCLALMVILFLLCGAFFTHVERRVAQNCHEMLKGIRFEPGITRVEDIFEQDLFKDKQWEERFVFGDAQFFQWDYGALTVWLIGNPVETLIINSEMGPARLNDFTTPIDPPHPPYPDPQEFRAILQKLNRIYLENDTQLGVGPPQYILYAFKRLEEGKPTFTRPPTD